MPKAWKVAETKAARFFGGMRNALSGMAKSTGTTADAVHDRLYIEVKHRKSHSAVTLWRETRVAARKEKKTPVVVLCERSKPGFWVLVHSSDLQKVASEVVGGQEESG